MFQFLLTMGFAFFSATGESSYHSSPNDFIEMVEVLGMVDTLKYRVSLDDCSVVYTKIWKNSNVVFEDTVRDGDVEKFRMFQEQLDSTSGRWMVNGMAFQKKDGSDDSKKFLRSVDYVKWLVPGDALIKRSKSVSIIPTDKMDLPFYEVVSDLQRWLQIHFEK